jgi:hypothetical protein
MTEQPADLTEGPPAGLTWGIKKSFMRYLSAIEDIAIGLHGGAVMLDLGALNFEYKSSTVDPATMNGTFDFAGSGELSAHGGMLSVTLSNPRVTVTGDEAILSIEKTAGDPNSRLALCTMTGGSYESFGSDLLWSSDRVSLAPEGVSVFGGQYATGQQLDPIYLRIAL